MASVRLGTAILCALFAGFGCGCKSNHHVSPWPQHVKLNDLWHPGSLSEHLERMDHELQAERFVVIEQINGHFPSGEAFCIRSYEGTDALGNMQTALRVASRYGVIMAMGPISAQQAFRGKRIRMITEPSKHPEVTMGKGIWRSGQDLNGDGLVDIVVQTSDESIEVWAIHEHGASPYPVESTVKMTRIIDINNDGKPELQGYMTVQQHGKGVPILGDVAVFSAGTYRSDHPNAYRWHRQQARVRKTQRTPAGMIERAWHQIKGRERSEEVLKQLDKTVSEHPELLGDDQQSEAKRNNYERWRNWLQKMINRQLSARGNELTSPDVRGHLVLYLQQKDVTFS